MKIRGNTVGTPIKPEKVVVKCQNLTEEEKAQARANFGIDELEDPNRHAKYFTITDDGIVSLKPEYRGACPSSRVTECPLAVSGITDENGVPQNGSKNAELPNSLVIPEVVDGVAVLELAPGMFLGNHAVVNITLPTIVETIPDRFCGSAWNLRTVNNTERILKIGKGAFQTTRLEKAVFPNLFTLGPNAFYLCSYLEYADIGMVKEIKEYTFYFCARLFSLKGCAGVETIGEFAFSKTYWLYSVDSFANVKLIGRDAFMRSRLNYNWESLSLPPDAFGAQATRLQINPTDFWSGCTYTACQNPVPTLLSQLDNRWKGRVINDKKVGNDDMTYGDHGCGWMTIMHLYSAVMGKHYTHVEQFENDCKTIGDRKGIDIIGMFDREDLTTEQILKNLDLSVTRLNAKNDNVDECLQDIYDALEKGSYVYAKVGKSSAVKGDKNYRTGIDFGYHAAMVYGVNTMGELLYADSSNMADSSMEIKAPIKYPMPIQNSIDFEDTGTQFYFIVSKPAE